MVHEGILETLQMGILETCLKYPLHVQATISYSKITVWAVLKLKNSVITFNTPLKGFILYFMCMSVACTRATLNLGAGLFLCYCWSVITVLQGLF